MSHHYPAGRCATVSNMSTEQQTPTAVPHGAPVLYTVNEACAILRIARSTLWKLTKDGKLYAVRVAGAPRYPRESIDAYLRGEQYSPHAPAPHGQADVSTWPPTPSLLTEGTS